MHFHLEPTNGATILRLHSEDGTNRLTRAGVVAITAAVRELAPEARPLIITGNQRFFSAGADLNEIRALTGPEAFAFSRNGQRMTDALEAFPAPVVAAINGYCMGGAMDLVLACAYRIASPHAIFGHRGAALGLITGWGGTQRLARQIGLANALEMFVPAIKVSAAHALRCGLVNALADNPVAEALRWVTR